MQINPALLERLGLPADASEDDVNAALEAAIPEAADPATQPTTTEGEPADPPPSEQPNTDDPGTVDPQPVTPPEGVDIPEGLVLVDAEAWRQTQVAATRGAQAADQMEADERRRYLDAAVQAGKFAPAQRPRYEALLTQKDPAAVKAARALIDSLAGNAVPVTATGHGHEVEASGDDAYPTAWLPEVHNRRPGTVTKES